MTSTNFNSEFFPVISLKTGKVKQPKSDNLSYLSSGGNPLDLLPLLKAAGYTFKAVRIDGINNYTIHIVDHVKKTKGVETRTPYGCEVKIMWKDTEFFWVYDSNKISSVDVDKIASKVAASLIAMPIALMQDASLASSDIELSRLTYAALVNLVSFDLDNDLDAKLKIFSQPLTEAALAIPALAVLSPKDWVSHLENETLRNIRVARFMERQSAKA